MSRPMSGGSWVPALASGLVILLAFSFGLATPLAGAFIHSDQRISQKASPRLMRDLAASSPEDTLKVWVFFRDRGLRGDELNRLILQAEASLDPHQRWRRLVRGRAPLASEEDLPLPAGCLAALEAAGARLRAQSRWLCAASVAGTPPVIRRVAALPFVDHMTLVARAAARERFPVSSHRAGSPGPADSSSALRDTYDYGLSYGQLAQIQVPALHAAGYTGAGVRVAILDTGFRLAHEALAPLHVIAEWDFVYGDSITANEPGEDTEWQDYHGTLTLSLLGGYRPGHMLGPAFGADFILAKTEVVHYERPVEEDWWVAGIEWAESLGAEVVSSSLGYFDFDPGYPDYTYADMDGDTAVTTIAADRAASLGLVVCNCMGNYGDDPGFYTKMVAPADGDSILGIGAVNAAGNVTAYSSRGPTYDGRTKPDLCARGDIDIGAYSMDLHGYTTETGTSCAAPLAAGAAALLLQAHPQWGPDDLANALRQTATRATSPDTLFGWGIVQAHDALVFAGATSVTGPPEGRGQRGSVALTVFPNPSRGETHILCVARDNPPLAPPAPASASATAAAIAIYNLAGRLVHEANLSWPASGAGASYVWNGRDRDGRRVSPGIYLIRFASADRRAATKLVVLP